MGKKRKVQEPSSYEVTVEESREPAAYTIKGGHGQQQQQPQQQQEQHMEQEYQAGHGPGGYDHEGQDQWKLHTSNLSAAAVDTPLADCEQLSTISMAAMMKSNSSKLKPEFQVTSVKSKTKHQQQRTCL